MRNIIFFFLVLSIITGLLIGVQLKNSVSKIDLSAMGDLDILFLWREVEKSTEELQKENNGLKNEIKKLENEISFDEDTTALLKKREDLKTKAGFGTMIGTGLVVTLADSNQKVRERDDPYFYLIHDSYLRAVVNVLKSGGARGISIGSERLNIGSKITCVGKVIMVDGKRIAPPYEIKAIGDPVSLANIIRTSSFFRMLEHYRDNFGIQLGVKILPLIELPPSQESLNLELFEVLP